MRKYVTKAPMFENTDLNNLLGVTQQVNNGAENRTQESYLTLSCSNL